MRNLAKENDKVILYAQWRQQSEKRTLTWNYGNGKTKTESLKPGDMITQQEEEPIKDGYSFSGWYESNTKYSHTPNIDDTGEASGTYASNYKNTDTVTIPGASKLKIDVYYSTENEAYDWLAIYDKNIVLSDSNYSESITGKLSEGKKHKRRRNV